MAKKWALTKRGYEKKSREKNLKKNKALLSGQIEKKKHL